jgi:MFS family permease
MMLSFNLVYALAAGPMGALSDRFGRRRFLVTGWVLYAAVYLGFARASTGWHTWALMCVYGVYYGMTHGVAKAYVADLVPSEKRGTAYGVYNAAVGVTAFPASLLAGLLWQGAGDWPGLGPSAPFVFGAVLALAAATMLFLSRSRSVET